MTLAENITLPIEEFTRLPPEAREKILAEAKLAWDREYQVSHLPDKLNAIIKRRHS